MRLRFVANQANFDNTAMAVQTYPLIAMQKNRKIQILIFLHNNDSCPAKMQITLHLVENTNTNSSS